MDMMKCDMGGGAAVLGILYAIAKAKLPVHVVGLIPATENRPGGNAYAPGDVIHMMDNTSVEVLNTDAEGRLLWQTPYVMQSIILNWLLILLH